MTKSIYTREEREHTTLNLNGSTLNVGSIAPKQSRLNGFRLKLFNRIAPTFLQITLPTESDLLNNRIRQQVKKDFDKLKDRIEELEAAIKLLEDEIDTLTEIRRAN